MKHMDGKCSWQLQGSRQLLVPAAATAVGKTALAIAVLGAEAAGNCFGGNPDPCLMALHEIFFCDLQNDGWLSVFTQDT